VGSDGIDAIHFQFIRTVGWEIALRGWDTGEADERIWAETFGTPASTTYQANAK
jgi:hypothetical protein